MQAIKAVGVSVYFTLVLVACGSESGPTQNERDMGPDAAPGLDMSQPDEGFDSGIDQDASVDASSDAGPSEEEVCDDNLDNSGNGLVDCADPTCSAAGACADIPVVPADLVPAGGAFSAGDLVLGLTREPNPIHRDLQETIDPYTGSVLRGKVINQAGQPIAGARVDFFDRPELGWTLTRADGMFDLAAAPSPQLQVRVSKAGHPDVYRPLSVMPSTVAWVDRPIALTPFDENSTSVTLGQATVAQGSVVDDGEGKRQGRVYFPSGTSAELEFADGSRQDAPELTMRITEYTTGDFGPQSMPGPLPNYIAYTWAAELSADEAVAAGARHVRFSQPVSLYLDNFLEAQVGALIPFGAYEPTEARWTDEPNGIVARVLSVENGRAVLDLEGDDSPTDSTTLEEWEFDEDELETIANMFGAGDTFWRARIDHFSAVDCNFFMSFDLNRMTFPDSSGVYSPDVGKGRNSNRGPFGADCSQDGSVIDCQRQRLRDFIPVSGTPYQFWISTEDSENGAVVGIDLLAGVDPSEFVPERILGVRIIIEVLGHRYEFSRTVEDVLAQPIFTAPLPSEDAWGNPVVKESLGSAQVVYDHIASYAAVAIGQGGSGGTGFSSPGAAASFVTNYSRDANTFGLGYKKDFIWDPSSLGAVQGTISTVHSMSAGSVLRGNQTQFGVPELRTRPRFLARDNCTNCYDPPIAPNTAQSQYGNFSGQFASVASSGLIYGVVNTNIYTAGNGTTHSSYTPEFATVIYRRGYDGQTEVLHRLDEVFPHDLGGAQVSEDESTFIFWINDRLISVDLGTGTSQDLLTDAPMTRCVETIINDVAFAPDGGLIIASRGLALVPGTAETRSHVPCLRRLSPQGDFEDILFPSDFVGGETWIATSVLDVRAIDDVAVDTLGKIYLLASGLDGPFNSQSILFELGPAGVLIPRAGHNETRFPIASRPEKAASLALRPDHTESLHIGANQMPVFRTAYANANGTERTPVIVGILDDIAVFLAGGGDSDSPDCSTEEGLDASSCRIGGITPQNEGILIGVYGSNTLVVGRLKPTELVIGLRRSASNGLLVGSPDSDEVFEFDWAGRHLATYDPATGQPIRVMNYNNGILLNIDETAQALRTEFENDGSKMTAIIAPRGQRTELVYEAKGLTQLKHSDQSVDEIDYDDEGRIIERTLPNGTVKTYDWANGLLMSATNSFGTALLARQSINNGVEVTYTDPLGLDTVYFTRGSIDGNFFTRTTLPTGEAFESSIQPDGTAQIQQGDGSLVEVLHPPGGNPSSYGASRVRRTYPSGRIIEVERAETIEWDSSVNAIGVESRTHITKTTGNFNTRQFTETWNAADKTASIVTGANRRIDYTFDDFGRVLTETRQNTTPRVFTYDLDGNLLTDVAGNLSWTYEWDGPTLTRATNALGEAFQMAYDDRDSIVTQTLPGGQVWNYEWDSQENLTAVVAPRGGRFQMTYDALDNRSGFVAPGMMPWLYTWEAGLRLGEVERPDGSKSKRFFDSAGRLIREEAPEAIVTFAYVPASERPLTVTRNPMIGSAHTMTYSYDGDLITGWSTNHQGQNRTVDLTYNALAEVTGVTDGVVTLTATRGSDGQMTAIGPYTITRSGPMGAPTRYTSGTHRLEQTYDTHGQLTGRSLFVGSLLRHRWVATYDDAGRIATRATTLGGTTLNQTLEYDPNGQLIATTEGGAAAESYAYDADGNIVDNNGVALTYDLAGQALTRGAQNLVFDDNGRLVDDGAFEYLYGAHGELLLATRLSDNLEIEYGWDWLGRLASRSVNGDVVAFRYLNPSNPYQLSVAEYDDGSIEQYFYTVDGTLIEIQKDGVRYFVGTDTVGTPHAIFDSSGAVVREIERGAFGEILTDSAPNFVSWVGFASGIEDPLTGLIRFGFRDYHPLLGRFTAMDPAGFGGSPTNLYMYAANNPAQFSDPTGLICVGGTAYAGFGGGIQVCYGKEGFSACSEIGFGAGAGLDIEPFGKTAKTGAEFSATAKGTLGFVTGETGGKIDLCGKATAVADVGVAGRQVSFGNTGSDPKLGVGPKPKPTPPVTGRPKPPQIGAKVELKAAVKVCDRF